MWSIADSCLYWVDIFGRRVHRFDPSTGRDTAWAMPDIVSFAAPHADGGLVVCLRSSVWRVDPARNTFHLLAELPLPEASRLNDAVVDREGRLWVGSMATPGTATPDGALWRIGVDGDCAQVVGGLHSPNGLAIAPDERTFYLSDSHPSVRTIWAFDFARGALSSRRIFVDTRSFPGRPDGGCVDADGAYWMAAVDGWCVLRLDDTGRILADVSVPVAKPSKAAFGGTDLDVLYVTSLRRNVQAAADSQPAAGGLFAARPGVRGLPQPDCRVRPAGGFDASRASRASGAARRRAT